MEVGTGTSPDEERRPQRSRGEGGGAVENRPSTLSSPPPTLPPPTDAVPSPRTLSTPPSDPAPSGSRRPWPSGLAVLQIAPEPPTVSPLGSGASPASGVTPTYSATSCGPTPGDRSTSRRRRLLRPDPLRPTLPLSVLPGRLPSVSGTGVPCPHPSGNRHGP